MNSAKEWATRLREGLGDSPSHESAFIEGIIRSAVSDALEEAAKVADAQAAKDVCDTSIEENVRNGYSCTSRMIARDVRALKEPAP